MHSPPVGRAAALLRGGGGLLAVARRAAAAPHAAAAATGGGPARLRLHHARAPRAHLAATLRRLCRVSWYGFFFQIDGIPANFNFKGMGIKFISA